MFLDYFEQSKKKISYTKSWLKAGSSVPTALV